MAMYITYRGDNGNELVEEWHVGQPRQGINPRQIVEIQADGDELAFIRDNFRGIRRHNLRRFVWRWYDEDAK